jgi:hypothetical protein
MNCTISVVVKTACTTVSQEFYCLINDRCVCKSGGKGGTQPHRSIRGRGTTFLAEVIDILCAIRVVVKKSEVLVSIPTFSPYPCMPLHVVKSEYLRLFSRPP